MDWRKLLFWRKSAEYLELEHSDKRNSHEGDMMVVRKLREEGADLSQKREVLHYLYFPSSETATQVAQELRADGYGIEQRSVAGGDQSSPNPWMVLAKMESVVNEVEAEKTTFRFTELANRHSGEYDGWEAASKH